MHPGDDEAAENEEEIDADIEVLQVTGEGMLAIETRLGGDTAGMVEDHEARGESAAELQRPEFLAVSSVGHRDLLTPLHPGCFQATHCSISRPYSCAHRATLKCRPRRASSSRSNLRLSAARIAWPRASASPTGT